MIHSNIELQHASVEQIIEHLRTRCRRLIVAAELRADVHDEHSVMTFGFEPSFDESLSLLEEFKEALSDDPA